MTDSGRATTQAHVRLVYADGEEQAYQAANGNIVGLSALSSMTFSLTDSSAQELLVWRHRVTAEGYSQQIAVRVKYPVERPSGSFR